MNRNKVPALTAALTCAVLLTRRHLRLREYRREVAERTSRLNEADGWTSDGYIRDQDCFFRYTYRTIPASGNGCGPVAAFNLRRYAGQNPDFSSVLAQMDAMHWFHMPGPTVMPVMRRYLEEYLPGCREVHGRSAAAVAAEQSKMGVFRYHEEGVPHFVSYVRAENGFRFFNVSTGEEDVTQPMSAFIEKHLRGGSVKLICWE